MVLTLPTVNLNDENGFLSGAESDTRERIRAIRNTIKNEEVRLRKQYPLLRHQNLIGLSWFLVSFMAMFVVGYFFLKRQLIWWLAVPAIALAVSILHELEHDLIHNLYFKGNKIVQNVMFFCIWISKLSLNPWYRRILHLRHHETSGSQYDIEERLIGIGTPFGFRRILATFHPLMSLSFFNQIAKDNKDFSSPQLVKQSVFIMSIYFVQWHLFFEFIRLKFGLVLPYPFDIAYALEFLPSWTWPLVRDIAVLSLLPNLLRQACLNTIATYCHYYGDVPNRNVFFQNQILNSWILVPLNLFCFNFGATHIIHHYVPDQTFYMRQMVAAEAQKALIDSGTRNNDFGIVVRDNRFGDFNGYSADAISQEALANKKPLVKVAPISSYDVPAATVVKSSMSEVNSIAAASIQGS